MKSINYLTTMYCFLIAFPCLGAKPIKDTIHSQIIGEWYMGTMTGNDNNLVINKDSIYLKTGGCFHQDSTIRDTLNFVEDKIILKNPKIIKLFGNSLRVINYKGNTILYPEINIDNLNHRNYSYHICFWRNIMKNGLQLPKEAYKVQK